MRHRSLAIAAVFVPALKRVLRVVLALLFLLCAVKPSDAGGMGRFLGSLLARGLVREAIVAGRSNTQPQSYTAKSYTPDVLTVAQLASCIKKLANSTRMENDWKPVEPCCSRQSRK
jgi:hypothetical protein